jgi:antitoxin MazE
LADIRAPEPRGKGYKSKRRAAVLPVTVRMEVWCKPLAGMIGSSPGYVGARLFSTIEVDTFVDTLSSRHPSPAAEAAMKVQIKKWGNSASVRIPASVMAAAALSLDQAVEVREEDGRVVIEPVTAPTYALDDLLAQLDPKTFPDLVDFGRPVGDEAW